MAKHQECLSGIIEKMGNVERGILKGILLYGKKIRNDEALQTMLNSTEALNKFGENVDVEWVSKQLEDIFTEGFGDIINDISCNYGKQLDVTINEILIKSLKVSKPKFSKKSDTVEGAVQRESWIAEQLMDYSIIKKMDKDANEGFVIHVTEAMKEKGFDPAKAVKAVEALFVGGLTAARAIMGFGFHKMVAVIANILVKMFMGRGLSIPADAALQRVAGVLLGPTGWISISWIITTVLILPAITALVNPHGYGKYIPAVFFIGVTRLSQNNGEGKYDQAEFLKKGLTVLSKLQQYPECPNLNVKAEVMDAGVFWTDIEIVDGWKLQKNNILGYYRILDRNKIRIAWGNETEIGKYFYDILS